MKTNQEAKRGLFLHINAAVVFLGHLLRLICITVQIVN